eukprot:scaffold195913_cov28-Tisochrysis_lutea.AAC.4
MTASGYILHALHEDIHAKAKTAPLHSSKESAAWPTSQPCRIKASRATSGENPKDTNSLTFATWLPAPSKPDVGTCGVDAEALSILLLALRLVSVRAGDLVDDFDEERPDARDQKERDVGRGNCEGDAHAPPGALAEFRRLAGLGDESRSMVGRPSPLEPRKVWGGIELPGRRAKGEAWSATCEEAETAPAVDATGR